jgi:hypothetical protein
MREKAAFLQATPPHTFGMEDALLSRKAAHCLINNYAKLS